MKTQYASVALTIAILLLARAASPSIDAQGNRQNSFEPPVVYQASGPGNASVIGTIDEFRNVLGGVNKRQQPRPAD